jgi:hypothetical protein
MKQIINKATMLILVTIFSLSSITSLGQAVLVDIDGIVNVPLSPVTNSPVDMSGTQYKIPLSVTLYNSAKTKLIKNIYKVEFTPSAGVISDVKTTDGTVTATLNVDKTVYDKVSVATKVTYEQDVCDGIEAAKTEFMSTGELEALNMLDFSFLNSKIAMSSPAFYAAEFKSSPTQQEYIDKFLVGNEFIEPLYSNAVAKFLVDTTTQVTVQMWLDRHLESFAGIDFTPYPNIAANILKAHAKMTCFRKLSIQDLSPLDIKLPAKPVAAPLPPAPKPADPIATPRTGGQAEFSLAMVMVGLLSILKIKKNRFNF